MTSIENHFKKSNFDFFIMHHYSITLGEESCYTYSRYGQFQDFYYRKRYSLFHVLKLFCLKLCCHLFLLEDEDVYYQEKYFSKVRVVVKPSYKEELDQFLIKGTYDKFIST